MESSYKKTKYIFVTGGVVSGLGKGITAASLGRLLKARGLKVASQKLDPYINVDPGTMSPYQHGEVYVTGGRRRNRPRSRSLRKIYRRGPKQILKPYNRQGILECFEQGAPRRISRRDRAGNTSHYERNQGISFTRVG